MGADCKERIRRESFDPVTSMWEGESKRSENAARSIFLEALFLSFFVRRSEEEKKKTATKCDPSRRCPPLPHGPASPPSPRLRASLALNSSSSSGGGASRASLRRSAAGRPLFVRRRRHRF